ncbi:hypothetical protein TNCV_4295451 [Trichonephila clavipes]|nr:hypothetical protein TNCV_4295451 [Trichonephila clavipes]
MKNTDQKLPCLDGVSFWQLEPDALASGSRLLLLFSASEEWKGLLIPAKGDGQFPPFGIESKGPRPPAQAEDLGLRVSDKMTVIDLKNIIIGSKDYEEEFVKAYLSIISEERFERETEGKIARQHAIEQLRLESELHKLWLEIENIRSNYREGRGTCEGTSLAVFMAEATIPVTTPIKEEKGMDDLRVVHVKVKGEQERVNSVIDTGAQMPVVRADVVAGQSIDSRGSI